MSEFVCDRCRKLISTTHPDGRPRWNEETTAAELESKHLCWKCFFWEEKVVWAKTGRTSGGDLALRMNEHHHVAKPSGAPGGFMVGFGGAKWIVHLLEKTADGRDQFVICTNMWHQGDVPERFKAELPDNAEQMPYDTKREDLLAKGWVEVVL